MMFDDRYQRTSFPRVILIDHARVATFRMSTDRLIPLQDPLEGYIGGKMCNT